MDESDLWNSPAFKDAKLEKAKDLKFIQSLITFSEDLSEAKEGQQKFIQV